MLHRSESRAHGNALILIRLPASLGGNAMASKSNEGNVCFRRGNQTSAYGRGPPLSNGATDAQRHWSSRDKSGELTDDSGTLIRANYLVR